MAGDRGRRRAAGQAPHRRRRGHIVRNDRRPAPRAPSVDGRPPVTGVINHIAWRLREFDNDAVREELERRGLNARLDQGTPEMNYDSYHVLDPDGWDLQISR